MPTMRIPKLALRTSKSGSKYPDIWVILGSPPTIVVTPEWARQSARERRKRLVHEMIHIKGNKHNERIGYNTYPAKDTFSRRVYEVMQTDYNQTMRVLRKARDK